MFKRLYIAYKGSKLWVRALDFAKMRNYAETKNILNQMETLGVHPNIEYCLLRGFIEYITENKKAASDYLNMGIEKIKGVQRFNENEKRYLIAYAGGILNEYGEINEEVNFSLINLEKIPFHLKDKFPLVEHPKW